MHMCNLTSHEFISVYGVNIGYVGLLTFKPFLSFNCPQSTSEDLHTVIIDTMLILCYLCCRYFFYCMMSNMNKLDKTAILIII